MELIDQHTKTIMEGCKERAAAAGLNFEDETLEYIVTNRDLLELGPKLMIPTLYDYWVHDVEVLREKGRYELYPGNPYETVINTRPAISFYNDNNPDWLNVMIFYHVLAHIDFFQNNLFFRHTWDYDFNGQALSDKRLISKLRSEKGRWVDYVIEFTRGIDNLVGYFDTLSEAHHPPTRTSDKLNYYFDVFLQSVKKISTLKYLKEVDSYNAAQAETAGPLGEQAFFSEVSQRYPEFDALYKKSLNTPPKPRRDVIQYLMEHSPFLNREENKWMKSIMQVIRNTSIFFQPQIRTKIMNEGWASYWHERLFLADDRIQGNEVAFARVNAGVTAMPRVGLNPYALGMRLFYYIEDLADKGRISYDFQRLNDTRQREKFDAAAGGGQEFIFRVRENFSDFMLVNNFIDQDFVTRNKLFVAGRRLNEARMVWEYYVKSRNADDYREMVIDSLFHPPYIEIDHDKSSDTILYLNHRFEGKPLVRDYIPNTMLGIEYLWGGPVKLETSEVADTGSRAQPTSPFALHAGQESREPAEIQFRRVVFTMKDRKLSKEIL